MFKRDEFFGSKPDNDLSQEVLHVIFHPCIAGVELSTQEYQKTDYYR
jgi:hypothetical protein